MASHCRPTLEALTAIMSELPNESRATLSMSMLADLIEAKHGAELATVAREELEALPSDFGRVLLASFFTAREAGVPFTIESEDPPKPVEAARAGRVTYRIEHDERGVRFYVSHVHGHHASYMGQAEAVTS